MNDISATFFIRLQVLCSCALTFLLARAALYFTQFLNSYVGCSWQIRATYISRPSLMKFLTSHLYSIYKLRAIGPYYNMSTLYISIRFCLIRRLPFCKLPLDVVIILLDTCTISFLRPLNGNFPVFTLRLVFTVLFFSFCQP